MLRALSASNLAQGVLGEGDNIRRHCGPGRRKHRMLLALGAGSRAQGAQLGV